MRLPWTLVPARFPLISTILWILQEQHTFENIGIVSLPGYAVFYYQQRSSVPDAGRYNTQIEWPKLFFFPCQAKKSLFFNRAFPIFVTKLLYNCKNTWISSILSDQGWLLILSQYKKKLFFYNISNMILYSSRFCKQSLRFPYLLLYNKRYC